jgi:hypothetical protein
MVLLEEEEEVINAGTKEWKPNSIQFNDFE